MRNLKRVLSTIMAVAMMMSLVVFSASATSFNDDKDIANKEAVDMAVALKIINGLPDGSFNPTGNVTRAEMAKMICILLNGGNDPQPGAKTGNPTFNDIRGHWAENYIEYCVAEGIIAGMGDGTFQPNGNVTGTQAAKMLLVALGYRAAAEGFNGANWAVKINVRATQKKLYDDISVTSVNNALSRDNAAQMIWNALNANVVEYTYELITVDGQLQSVLTARDKAITVNGAIANQTLLEDKYNQDSFVGKLTNITWHENDKVYVYNVDDGRDDLAFRSTVDYSHLFAMNVKAVYRTDRSQNTLFGMVADKSTVVASGTIGDISDAAVGVNSIKLDGTKYNTNGNLGTVKTYVQNQFDYGVDSDGDPNGDDTYAEMLHGNLDKYAPFTVKLIDTNNDNRVDTIVYLPFAVAEVSAVNNKNVILTNIKDEATVLSGTRTFDKEDHTLYSGIAKGDYVAVYAEVNGKGGNVFAELTSFEGRVTGTRTGEIRVGTTWYDAPYALTVVAGNEYTFFGMGNYVFFTDVVSEATLDNVAFVSAVDPVDPVTGGPFDVDRAKLYFSDGTNKVVDVDEVRGAFPGVDPDSDPPVPVTLSDLEDHLVTFTVKNGEYTLTLVEHATFAAVTATGKDTGEITEASSNITGKVKVGSTSYNIADDAFVFIKYDDDGTAKVKVITGKQAKDLNADFGATAEVLHQKVGSVNTVKVAAVIDTSAGLPAGLGQAGNFGYVTGIFAGADDDKKATTELEMWTADGLKTLYTYEALDPAIEVGAVVEYTDLGDREFEDATVVGTVAAITGIAGNEYSFTGDFTYALTSDTVVIYVNTADKEGDEETSIVVADEDDSGNYVNNALYVRDGEKLELLVIDTGNDYDTP